MTEPATWTLRRAGPVDAALLADVGTETFVETFGHLYAPEDLGAFLADSHSAAAYSGLLAEPGVAIWLAFDSGAAPAGYLVAGPCKLPLPAPGPRAGEIRRLYLRRNSQRGGLGSRFVDLALDWLDTAGYSPLYVGVWSGNEGAQRLYARFGFEKVGEYDFPVGRHVDREFILRRNRAP